MDNDDIDDASDEDKSAEDSDIGDNDGNSDDNGGNDWADNDRDCDEVRGGNNDHGLGSVDASDGESKVDVGDLCSGGGDINYDGEVDVDGGADANIGNDAC